MTSFSRSPVPCPGWARRPRRRPRRTGTRRRPRSREAGQRSRAGSRSGAAASESGGPPGGGSMRAQRKGRQRRPATAAAARPTSRVLTLHPSSVALLAPALRAARSTPQLLALALDDVRRAREPRTARCRASSPATSDERASRSASAPSRSHSRATSIASPSGTKTAVPSGSTACPPTRSLALAQRELGDLREPDDRAALALERARRRRPSWLTNARTAWPGCTPYSARMPRMAPTTSCTSPNSRERLGILGAARRGGATAPPRSRRFLRPAGNRRQSVSVTNGMTGWSRRSATSKVWAATARATSPPGTSP